VTSFFSSIAVISTGENHRRTKQLPKQVRSTKIVKYSRLENQGVDVIFSANDERHCRKNWNSFQENLI